VVEFCDGWFPRAGANFDAHTAMNRLRKHADAAGRDMSTLQVTVFRAPADKAALDSYRQQGIDRVLLEIPDTGRDEVLKLLDGYAKLLS
jgi:alkanesulfonate monooxygenase SsuD/methylene tetrahydromethanopterin reductase-like flavin-dependent oxidoreductase (luciferase family)